MHSTSRDRMYFLVKDPYWGFLWWEFSIATIERLSVEAGRRVNDGQFILRIHDVTDILFDGRNAHYCFDIEIHGLTDHWYLRVPQPGRVYCAEAGFKFSDSKVIPVVRSSAASFPRDRPSSARNVAWSSIAVDDK